MTDLATVLRGPRAVIGGHHGRVDLGIGADGRIAAVADAGTLEAAETIDCDGLEALPGAIDLHVHLATFFGGTTTRDDFYSGTVAALFGGTTTIAQFAIPRPGETTAQAVARTRREAEGEAVADYVIHGSVTRETYADSLNELSSVASDGIRTVKVFSAYTDTIGLGLGEIHRLLGRAADAGITVFVHAETDSLIREGIDGAITMGELGPVGHALSRPPLAESDAIRSIADLAGDRGATVYFVHVSGAPSIAALTALRAEGRKILAETCPHYLFLDESVYGGPDGARWICSPPIRSAHHRDALWDGLRRGVLDAVSSDHNCFDSDQKRVGPDFRSVPNGLPGIEHRVPLLVDAALAGRLSFERLIEVVAEGPARILGLWPRKGSLLPGADGDVVLVDPAGTTDLDAGHMATDFSPYEGRRAAGRIERVYHRGALVIRGGELLAERGSGAWLPLTSGPSQQDPTGSGARV